MHPVLIYLLLLLFGTAAWCYSAHAWVAAAVLLVLFALLLGRWAEIRFARWIRHQQLRHELRTIIHERNNR